VTEQLVENRTTDLAMPPIHAEIDFVSQAPVENDGSFLTPRIPKQSLSTPLDESTGVPFSIYPSEKLPPVIRAKGANIERQADWHHPFHPRSALIHGSLAQQALRSCRVQWVRYEEHHDGVGYHQTFAGPEIPDDEYQLFKTIVFASAGYVGKDSLRFNQDGQHTIHPLTDKERKRILKPGVLMIDDSNKVRSFLVDYGARHTKAHMDSRLIDELMNSTDLRRRKDLALDFIDNASEEVTSRFSEEFRSAKEERWLPNQRTRSAARYVSNLLMIQKDGSRTVNKQVLRFLERSLQVA
jgi:hypothetical protein